MQAQIMIPPLQRIPAEAVHVQPGASGHKNFSIFSGKVKKAFKIIAPGTVLVDLVKNKDFSRRDFALQDLFRGDPRCPS